MTNEELERLEAKASKCMKPHGYMTAEDFIAAANPQAILSLIQRVKEAESDAAFLEELFATPIAILQERARKEALEEAAKVAWSALNRVLMFKEDSSLTVLEDHVASAIRALGEKAG